MVQRFGRVNRFGQGDARIDLVHEAKPDEVENPYEDARWRTLALLQALPLDGNKRHQASPAVLADLPAADRQAAFTPAPAILPATDILFDAWTLTTIARPLVHEPLPGRPPVAEWLHGVAEWEPPETYVVWREEVERVTGDLLDRHKPEDLLEAYPLKPHELLRDRTSRVFDHLETMAARCPDLSVWLIESDGNVRVLALSKLAEKNKQKKPLVDLSDRTVILPPAVGGLERGMFDGVADFDEARRDVYDVADEWIGEKDERRRCRVWDEDAPPEGMRLVRTIDTRPDSDDEEDEHEQTSGHRYWYWYVRPGSADDDGSRTATEPQDLKPHLESAERLARALAAKLGLTDPEASAVALAASWHDLGKRRAIWQRSIGNRRYPQQVLAKSGGKMRPIDLSGYRHEFGSLVEVSNLPEFLALEPEVQELVLHLIGAHHGRARPHFPASETFDPEHTDEAAAAMAREVPRRFGRLQRKYGRWGLAYLESLVRAADALASQATERHESEPEGGTAAPSQETA